MILTKEKKFDRYLFTATYNGFKILGNSKGIAERIVFIDVVDQFGNYVTNYTWFDNMKGFKELNLEIGDRVSFFARLVYYKDQTLRYGTMVYPRLIYPTKMKKLYNPFKREEKHFPIKITARKE